jgi:ubiquinone/menaquinone biosynthesis C-methylase UbiE
MARPVLTSAVEGPDGAYYERVARWSSTPTYRAKIEALWADVGLGPGARVLDIGCGTGATMRWLGGREVRATGVDLPAAWMAACEERPAVRADAARLPFRDEAFDAVLLMHVVAHLRDPILALREARRVLRPGGKLGLATPNLRFLRVMRLVPKPLSRYTPDPTVERHYALRDVVDLLSRAGFATQTARSWGRHPPLLPFAPFRERLLVVAAGRT